MVAAVNRRPGCWSRTGCAPWGLSGSLKRGCRSGLQTGPSEIGRSGCGFSLVSRNRPRPARLEHTGEFVMSHPSGDWERAADALEDLTIGLQILLDHLGTYRPDFNADEQEHFIWRMATVSMEVMKFLENAGSQYHALPRSSFPLRSPDAPLVGVDSALPNYCEGMLRFGWKVKETLRRADCLNTDGDPKMHELADFHRQFCVRGPNGSRVQMFRNISARLFNELRINSARLAGMSYHVTESDDGQTSVTLHTPELKAIGQQKLAAITDESERSAVTDASGADQRDSVSAPVVLTEWRSPVIVLGVTKPPLTVARFAVVKALIEAGKQGLTKYDLVRESQKTDAVNILKRLKNSDAEWGRVIQLAGERGMGYRIAHGE